MKKQIPQKQFKMWIDGKSFNIERNQGHAVIRNLEHRNIVLTENLNHEFTINQTSDKKLETTFRLPSIYYINLHKFPEFSLQQLSAATNTEIFVPKHGNDGVITISSSNEADLVKSRETIHSAVIEIRERLKPLQFTSIPVTNEEIQKNFELFKESVLNDGPIKGMGASIFQSSLKLHLTLNVFLLTDNTEKAEAIAALNDCKRDVINPLITNENKLRIRVEGIDCMTNNYEKTYILYAKAKFVNEDNDLQNVVNSIANHFYERGLVKQYRDAVKLHVTLLNSKYRKPPTDSPTKRKSNWAFKKQPFDATKIMEKYKDYYFGESMFDALRISYMSSVGDDGFYKSLATVNF